LEVSGYLYAKDFPEIVEESGRKGRRPAGVGRRSSELGPQASGVGLQASGETLAGEGKKLRESLAGAVTEIQRLVQSARLGSGQKEEVVALRAETPLVLMGTAGAGSLGMSFEVTKVNVLNQRARIWKLIGVTFTGAAILRKDKAAFQDTWIELST
ncbi:MAG: hypothetical protein WCE52_15980, partial [Candidatus Acidiferrum sp.]